MKTNVDLILHHAVIYTVNKHFAKESAMAVKAEKIVAIGSNESILDHFESSLMVDAGNSPVYPGFIDSHAHFYFYGRSLQEANLTGSGSWEEALQRVRKFSENHIFPWIIGRGWNQDDWEVKRFPDNSRLNALFPDTPVLLIRIDGHAAIANRAALEKANIQPGDKLKGGEIEVKEGGLTGLLIDNAVELVQNRIPELSPDQKEKCLLAAQGNCFSVGLTTVDDCGQPKEMIQFIDRLQKEGKLKMRLYVMISDEPSNYDYYLNTGPYKTDRLNVNAFKLFSDGALGSRGACLLAPYSDRPGWDGFYLKPREYFEEIAKKLIHSDFQMCTHAIGDAANRMMLQVYGEVLKGKNDRRWRIEHAQILEEEDLSFFGKYNIVPSVQPTHATTDMYWVEDRLGAERLRHSYANKSLLKQNGWLPLGTDFPVEDINPMKTFYAAVSRQDASGYPVDGFQSQNALSREEALRGMTVWAAQANFEDREKGSLEPGKWADFVLLDRDIMKVNLKEVLETKVKATFIGGEKVY